MDKQEKSLDNIEILTPESEKGLVNVDDRDLAIEKWAGDAVKALTPKQLAFVIAYLTDAKYNAGMAAVMAGYGVGENALYAANAGYTVMQQDNVQRCIDMYLTNTAMRKSELTSRLAAIARVDIGQFIDKDGKIDHKAVRENGELVQSYSVSRRGRTTIKVHDALRAQSILAKHLGMVIDRIPENTEGTEGTLVEEALIILRRVRREG